MRSSPPLALAAAPAARLEPPLEEVADLLDLVPHAVALLDRGLRYDYVNVAYARRFGRAPVDLVGRSLREMLGDAAFDVARPSAERALAGELVRDQVAIPSVRGRDEIFDVVVAPRRDPGGAVSGCVVVLTDIEPHRRTIDALTEKLAHQAHHDALTDLPNRAFFVDHLRRTLARADRTGRISSVMVVDLDGFERINETLGYEAGDAILIETTRRMASAIREGDVLARTGDDHFAALVADLEHDEDAMRVARRLQDSLREPIAAAGHEILVRASIGVSVCPRDGRDPAALLRYADAALSRAKAGGRNAIECFSPEMMRDAAERLVLESRLAHAIEEGRLETWLQPQVDLGTREVVGFESLSRWRDEERGWISPGVFIPLAMKTGLMLELGRQVLRASCRTLRRLDAEGLGADRVAVNVAAPQLHQAGFVDEVLRILTEEGLPPQRLELEITESAVIEDLDRVAASLERLRDAGVSISLDDFGTGYSSLTYLRRLPVDTVKLDKSFIDPIETDHVAAGMVTSIVSMAHWLGLSVVAEGVETAAQAELLHGMGCDIAQGYHFARPTPPDELSDLLRGGTLPRA